MSPSVFEPASAATLVACAYTTLDLFAGSERELLDWERTLPPGDVAVDLIPKVFDRASASVLREALARADIVGRDDSVDTVRLLQFREVVELLPIFSAEERTRIPSPKPQVVFTLPEQLKLAEDERFLSRSLSVRIAEALRSALDEPVLLASPFWSESAAEILAPALTRSIDLNLPITIAGARKPVDDEYDHLEAMLNFGRGLQRNGARVTYLEYRPPIAGSLFHAKLACGHVGYLGSGNFTGHGLGKHVEAGVPLKPQDVARVWWLIKTLSASGLLVEIA